MEYICITIIATIAYIFISASSHNIFINKKEFCKVWRIILIIAFIMAFIFEPNPSLNIDLLRINARLDDIRNLGLDKALQYTDIENLYVFRYWLYINSLLSFNGLLTAVPFSIDVYIFGKITSDILSKQKNIKVKYLSLGLLVWISLIGLKLAITDIRCVFAMSICCDALWLEFIQKERKIFSFVLYIIAFYTHHYTMVFLISRFIVEMIGKIKNKKIVVILSFIIILLPICISLVLPSIGSFGEYFILINQKVAGYDRRSYFLYREMSQRVLYICMIIILIYSTLFSAINHIMFNNGKDKNFMFLNTNLALFTVSVLLLGFFSNYLMLERGMYIIAFLLSMTYLLMPEELHRKRNVIFIVPILLYILFINDINFFIVNKLGYSYLQF